MMKKVNLLSKSQMKNILGGLNEMGTCKAKCLDGGSVECAGASCSAIDASGGTDGSCTGTTDRNCSAGGPVTPVID